MSEIKIKQLIRYRWIQTIKVSTENDLTSLLSKLVKINNKILCSQKISLYIQSSLAGYA